MHNQRNPKLSWISFIVNINLNRRFGALQKVEKVVILSNNIIGSYTNMYKYNYLNNGTPPDQHTNSPTYT